MTTDNDLDLFDSINSSERGAEIVAPEPEVKPQEPVRDETGKFAKAEVPTQSAPVVETLTTPEAEGPVPVAAVQDERRKRQDAERRADELERRLAALEKPAVAPPAPVQPASLWDDPDAYLKGQLSPVQQQVAEMREMLMESRAEAVHGADKLAAAKEAVKAYFGKPEGAAIHQELMSGGNPYDNLVKWHARQQTLATVGNDPQAWLQSELDKKLADPAFLAQAVERARASAVPIVSARPNAPRTSLPSLSNIPASGNSNVASEQQNDGDMFSSITTAPRRR